MGRLVWIWCFLIAVAGPLSGVPTTGATEPVRTTDDPRRIRVPPPDESELATVVLQGGTLIDGTGGAPLQDAVLVIRGNRIAAVGPAREVSIPRGTARIVDTSGLYIVPGLIDLHIHFAQGWKADDSLYGDSDAAAAIRGTKKLERLLDEGITTARDVATRSDVALKLKEAVSRRILDGPRIFWAGTAILARGGHGDEGRSGTSEASKGTIHSGGPYARIANGADDWQLAVREQIRNQADLIKLFAPFSRDEITAAISEAHMQNIRVTVDAYDKYTEWAVEAGADSIEHTLAMSDAAISLMAERGTALVPTLTPYYVLLSGGYAEEAGLPPGGYFNDPHRSFPLTHDNNLEVVGKAHSAGVSIGVGTDMGFAGERYYPGAYFMEMGFLKDAGLDDDELLQSATRVGAEILGMADKLGTLEEGMLADILVVRNNPLEDFRNLQSIRLVIADGRITREYAD